MSLLADAFSLLTFHLTRLDSKTRLIPLSLPYYCPFPLHDQVPLLVAPHFLRPKTRDAFRCANPSPPPSPLIRFVDPVAPQVPFHLASNLAADDPRIAHLRQLMPHVHTA